MFSLRFTIALLCFLLVPFLLKYRWVFLEPYPAIILPSGASKISLNREQFHVGITELHAQNLDGNWEQLNVKELLDPIPVQYHHNIFSSNFGLKDQQMQGGRIVNLLNRLKILRRRNASLQDKERGKRWLAERIEKQGLSGSAIKLLQKSQTIEIESGEILKEKVVKQKIIYLD